MPPLSAGSTHSSSGASVESVEQPWVQPDVVILDNVMSLIAGVMKEEEPWQQTLPLVLGITALSKAQIWLDHTGHNSDRQYGTSTKGWFFDAIGVMLRPDGEQVGERETCFDLSFDPPTRQGPQPRSRPLDRFRTASRPAER